MAFVNIVCINQGDYQGRGVQYVNTLHDMVTRNLPTTVEGRFHVFTDALATGYHPDIQQHVLPRDLKGWWCKLLMFKPDLFPADERMVYFDLDVCITGALDPLIAYDGEFATLTDFYTPAVYNTSVMAWRSGFGKHIWEGWNMAGRPLVAGGDQIAIWHQHRGAERLQELFPRAFVSFKQSAQLAIPDGAKVVCFHGAPKPAEVTTGWVPRVWCLGGISVFDYTLHGNIEASAVLKNIRHALTLKAPFIGRPVTAHKREAIVIGGGPSLNKPYIIEEIRSRWQAGAAVIALNNSWRWLNEHKIFPDYHVMLDARPENIAYVPSDTATVQRLYSAQVDTAVQDATPARKTTYWLPFYPGLPEHLGIEAAFIGGGSTVGLQSLSLLHHLGFRVFHLYGYDSSYEQDDHHAYAQTGNDGQAKITVEFEGIKYVSSPWMVAQANEFRDLAANLVNAGGAEVHVHGNGLLQSIAAHMAAYVDPEGITKINGVWWPSADNQASNIILQELLDLPQILKHVPVSNGVCVQAGGNVGLWPRELAKHFARVWSFEPDPVNFKCMNKNLENVLNVHMHQAALGDNHRQAGLVRDVENCGAYYIDENPANASFTVTTIDSLKLDRCELILLDIEGYELLALHGAQKTINEFHPVIVCEEKGLGSRFGIADDAISCLLSCHGYILAASIGRDALYLWRPKGLTP